MAQQALVVRYTYKKCVSYGRAAFELPSRHVLSPDSILNLFYFWDRISRAFYPAQTTIAGAKAILSGTYFFLMSKPTKKVAGDRHIAGENNGRFFKFKVAEKFYQINTNNVHNYGHAWKWSRGSVLAPPWRYFCRFWLRSPLRFVRDITIIWP